MKNLRLEYSGMEGPAYISLTFIGAGEVAKTEDIDGLLVDFDKDGKALGLEILNPSAISVGDIIKVIEKVTK